MANSTGYDSTNDLLPFEDYNVKDFTRECRHLFQLRDGEVEDEGGYHQGFMRLAHFAVSGRHPDHHHQAHVDALCYAPANDTIFTLTRDFDSLVCWTNTLAHINAHLYVHPIPLFKHTMDRPLHLSKRVLLQGACGFFLPVNSFMLTHGNRMLLFT
jgi:hypothetical protein